MRRELYTECKIGPYTWNPGEDNEPPPIKGDFLLSSGGSAWLIQDSRPIKGEVNRRMFRCLRVSPSDIKPDDRVCTLIWQSRRRVQ